ncbi:MAG: asparagine synthase (glutamine-hydrolyzing) [Ferrovibrio sp.]
MCGIAGILGRNASGAVVGTMLDRMRHRGPDGRSQWGDPEAQIELGHLRLAVIDLVTGDQPMVSPDGRYVLIFNGEIYNYLELRPALSGKGWSFVTASDTEVLLAGLVLEGPKFLEKTIGMFALALWDSHERRLFLARDRMGIKPLYIAETQDGFAFSSEFRSLLAVPGVDAGIDAAALEAFFTLRYVPSPLTMVRGIRKFPAGHFAWVSAAGISLEKWWEVDFSSAPGAMTRAQEEQLDGLLDDAVRLCLRSDVPYGAFLSGGVDSGIITALMAKHSAQPVKTYSVGFAGVQDESEDARRVAQSLGTAHSELTLGPADLRSLPDIVRSVDEPFPDPIVMAMTMLAQRAQADVKVILTGEGADELFGGYIHHRHLALLDRYANAVPQAVLNAGGWLAERLPQGVLERLFDYPVPPGPEARGRLASLIRAARSDIGRYLAYVSLFDSADRRRLLSSPASEDGIGLVMRDLQQGSGTFIDRLWSSEHRYWLADNILFKQDKTLMAHSVEGRVPFCDHRLVEFVAKLPLEARFGPLGQKSALRQAALRLAPQLPGQAGKRAFMIPQEGAYAVAIREMSGDLLLSRRFRENGLFDGAAVAGLLDRFRKPSLLPGKQLLSVMMFALWEREVLAAA